MDCVVHSFHIWLLKQFCNIVWREGLKNIKFIPAASRSGGSRVELRWVNGFILNLYSYKKWTLQWIIPSTDGGFFSKPSLRSTSAELRVLMMPSVVVWTWYLHYLYFYSQHQLSNYTHNLHLLDLTNWNIFLNLILYHSCIFYEFWSV